MKRILTIALATVISGCTQVTTEQEWTQLNSYTNLETGLVWLQTKNDKEIVNRIIKQELQKPLDIEAAIRIALLNNRELQSTFENIGVSKSDLVQAGLFSNPNLSALFRFPTSGGKTNIEADGFLSISDLWLLPLRKRVAEANLEKTLFHVANKVLKTKRNARKAFIDLHFTQKIYQEILKHQKIFHDLSKEAKRRRNFGYMEDIDVNMAEVAAHEADVLVNEYRMKMKIAESNLLKLLSLQSKHIKFSDQDVGTTSAIPSINSALEQAQANRFDLRMAEMRVKEREKIIDLNSYMVFKDVNAGVSFEKESEGSKLLGPALELEVPLFDQNQAQISKAEFEWRKAQKDLCSLMQNISLNIETLLARAEHLTTKAQIIKAKIIPLQQKSVNFVSHWSNLMQINRFIFLQTRKDLMNSKIEYLKTLTGTWRNFYNLEYELGR